jgi:hypothetical protein
MFDIDNEDMELDEMFHGEKKPLHPDTVYETFTKPARKPVAPKESNPGKSTPKEEKPVESPCEPVKPASDSMEKIKQMAKDVCKYAALSLILFWWQQTGRLEETTAWYSLLVCVGMVFFSVGKNWRGGVK